MMHGLFKIQLLQHDVVHCHGLNLFKSKLELVTGANCGSMVLEVYNKENQLVCGLDNDSAMLGSYPIDDGMRLHVSFNRKSS